MSRTWDRLVLSVYAAAVFVGATLVFLVQPLAARLVLPSFGGSPAVWTTSLLFFQLALLAGYAWAHVSTSRLGDRRQPAVQLALLLLPLLVLPFVLPGWVAVPRGVEPAIWVLLVLAAMVGLPYVAVTTASPVLQRWFAATGHPHAHDPYFLYAMGNTGSLLGLLAYPFVIEPNLALRDQAVVWSAGYVAFLGLSAAAAALLWADRRRRAAAERGVGAPDNGAPVARETAGTLARPSLRRRLGWVAMAFVPSSLMLGVTTYISADLAAVPLLWVIPLSLYLVTFMLAFSPRNPLTVGRLSLALPPIVIALTAVLTGAVRLPLLGTIGLNVLAFFVAALLAHTRLASDRPPTRHLTEFYLLLAVGGALGGTFNALVAPTVFDRVVEYPLAIMLALLIRPRRPSLDPAAGRRANLLDPIVGAGVFVGAIVVLAALSRAGVIGTGLAIALTLISIGTLIFVRRPVRFGLAAGGILLIPLLVGQVAVFEDRSFFGISRVIDEGEVRLVTHGTTTHGGQLRDPARAREPLTYYHRSGPFGQAVQAFLAAHPDPVRIGVVGLGAGGIAAYVRPGDAITFFEIDPVVVRIAETPALFTFLSDAPGSVRVVLGDGRLTVAAEPPGSFDLLILDAFSGDAPPAHLLTVEAIDMYLERVAPGGLLMFNVSNRYVDLERVVAAGLRARGLPVLVPLDPSPGSPPEPEKEPAGWVVSARSAGDLDPLAAAIGSRPSPVTTPRAWTDDFSDLVSAIQWDR